MVGNGVGVPYPYACMTQPRRISSMHGGSEAWVNAHDNNNICTLPTVH